MVFQNGFSLSFSRDTRKGEESDELGMKMSNLVSPKLGKAQYVAALNCMQK